MYLSMSWWVGRTPNHDSFSFIEAPSGSMSVDIAIETHRHLTRLDHNRPNRTRTRRAVHLLSTSNVANADCGCGSTPTGSADDATASLPWRARLRHVDNCQRDIP